MLCGLLQTSELIFKGYPLILFKHIFMGYYRGFEYTRRRRNEDEGEMEYLVNGEWELASDLKELAAEMRYWTEEWAAELYEDGENLISWAGE